MKAVIFDLDGTLLNCPYDFVKMRAAVLALIGKYGLARGEFGGLGVLEAVAEAQGRLGGEEGERFRGEADDAILAIELEGASHSLPLEGAKEALEWMRGAGLKIGIVTRNSGKVVEQLLARVAFSYDALLAREDVPQVKPHPAHVTMMLARLGCQAAEAIMVGDHVWDMECGRAVGLRCVGVATGASSAEALFEAGAEAVLEGIALLPTWLRDNCLI